MKVADDTRLVAVIGGRAENVSDPSTLQLATEVGAELAARGYGVISGGDGGVAAAVNLGCRHAGGTTIALLKGTSGRDCGPEVQWPIPTSLDLGRSVPLIWCGVGVLAFPGRFGTLFEIALALDAQRPMVLVGPHPLLNLEAVAVRHCAVLPFVGLGEAGTIVDTLEEVVTISGLHDSDPHRSSEP
jgi:uncharacterized protein (TIGR00725 family)